MTRPSCRQCEALHGPATATARRFVVPATALRSVRQTPSLEPWTPRPVICVGTSRSSPVTVDVAVLVLVRLAVGGRYVTFADTRSQVLRDDSRGPRGLRVRFFVCIWVAYDLCGPARPLHSHHWYSLLSPSVTSTSHTLVQSRPLFPSSTPAPHPMASAVPLGHPPYTPDCYHAPQLCAALLKPRLLLL